MGDLGLTYHLYLIPEEVDLKDAVGLVYGDLMQPEGRNKRDVLLGDMDRLYVFEVALYNEQEALYDETA